MLTTSATIAIVIVTDPTIKSTLLSICMLLTLKSFDEVGGVTSGCRPEACLDRLRDANDYETECYDKI